MAPMNPRVQRDELKPFVGKKVTIGTTSYHYLSGRLVEILLEADQLRLTVAGKEVRVPMEQVATIAEAPESQAEYLK